MTSADIIAIVTALPALIVALFGAYKAIAAATQAQANKDAHDTSVTRLDAAENKIHAIALALPSAAQQVLPAAQALAAQPGIAPYVAAVAPTLQKLDDVLAAVEKVSAQVKAATPTNGNGPKPLTAGLTGAAT